MGTLLISLVSGLSLGIIISVCVINWLKSHNK
jgi:hypothetical protein